MCRGRMEMERFFPPSTQWKTYMKGKTNPVLIMPLKSQMVAFHDILGASVTMVFLVELAGSFGGELSFNSNLSSCEVNLWCILLLKPLACFISTYVSNNHL